MPVSMSLVQKQQYKHLLAHHFDGIRRVGSEFKRRAPLVNMFAQLRKTCQHPYLFPEAEPVGEVCMWTLFGCKRATNTHARVVHLFRFRTMSCTQGSFRHLAS